MKFTKETVAILKNFAAINSNLMLRKGKALSTINAAKNVFATATITEELPADFGIYDTNEFLGVLSLFADPEVTFAKNHALFKEGNSSVKFYSADESVLTIPGAKPFNFPSPELEFNLTAVHLANIQKTAGILRATDVSIEGKDGVLSVLVSDLKNPAANSYNLEIGATDKTFTANLKIENIRLMAVDYAVSISSKKISRFVSADGTMTVYIALESTSKF